MSYFWTNAAWARSLIVTGLLATRPAPTENSWRGARFDVAKQRYALTERGIRAANGLISLLD